MKFPFQLMHHTFERHIKREILDRSVTLNSLFRIFYPHKSTFNSDAMHYSFSFSSGSIAFLMPSDFIISPLLFFFLSLCFYSTASVLLL